MSIAFEDFNAEPSIRGFLHEPTKPSDHAIALTHGAGGDCRSKLLVAVCEALAALGFTVLRFDLPFRIARPFGPPPRGSADRDRAGLRRAAAIMQSKVNGRIFLGGHSYGGRQASILVSDEPDLAEGLLLLSYPLHPPQKPTELRTDHFPNLRKPALFVHGVRDEFGTSEEMETALRLIPARHSLFEVNGSGHELLSKKNGDTLPAEIATGFQKFIHI